MLSPDSKRIALHISGLDRSRSHDIYVVNLDGSNPQPIASTGTERSVDRPLNVAWSSSDRIAVYYQFFDWLRYAPILDDYATYTLKSDGSDLQQVRHIFGGRSREHVSLVWSPDGSRIAFIEQGVFDSFANVLVANPDGAGLQQLTHVLGEVSDITWSPDGKHMLFVSSRSTWHELQDDKEIYIIDVP